MPGNVQWLDQKGEIAVGSGVSVLDGVSKGSGSYSGTSFVEGTTQNLSDGLVFGFEGSTAAGGNNLRLVQFTLIRYPAQANP